jgi:hypothetical protein
MAARRTERTTTTATRGGRTAAATTTTEVTTTTAKSGGLGIAEAMGIVTFLLLLAAIVLMDKYLGAAFNQGMFFKT